MSTLTEAVHVGAAAEAPNVRARRVRRPPLMVGLSAAAAGLVLLPLVFLCVQAGQAGWGAWLWSGSWPRGARCGS